MSFCLSEFIWSWLLGQRAKLWSIRLAYFSDLYSEIYFKINNTVNLYFLSSAKIQKEAYEKKEKEKAKRTQVQYMYVEIYLETIDSLLSPIWTFTSKEIKCSCSKSVESKTVLWMFGKWTIKPIIGDLHCCVI